MSPLRFRLAACAVALAAAGPLSGCQVAPGTGREGFNIVSDQEAAQMGAQGHPEILKEFGGAYDNPELQAYVAGLGQKLVRQTETPGAQFRFTVLNSPIVNAMAMPGGYVYVTRGLLALADNEAELAGVMGHEIGHVTGQHTAQRYSRTMAANVLTGILGAVVGVPGVGEVASLGASAYLQGFSRDQESEADHLGIRYMAKAGYDPRYMATFLNKLRDESQQEAVLAGKSPDAVDEYNMMASHPRTIDRVEAAAQEVAASGTAAGGEVKGQAYLHAIDGLVYGDAPGEGIIRDRVFSHGELGFRFEVPEGFRLANSPKAVTATDGAGATIRFDTGRGQGSPAQHMQQWAKGIHLADIETLTVNGMSAATGRARVSTNKGAMDMRAVVVAGNGTMYRFMFLTPPDRTEALSEGLRRTTYSFRMLSPEERQAVKPLRIKVVTVKAGDSVESLAARLPFNSYRVQRFEVLNGLHDGDQVKPGQMVKLVE